jgi:HEAT repeat protein
MAKQDNGLSEMGHKFLGQNDEKIQSLSDAKNAVSAKKTKLERNWVVSVVEDLRAKGAERLASAITDLLAVTENDTPALMEYIGDQNQYVQSVVIGALATLGDHSIRPLLLCLKSSDQLTITGAVAAIRRMSLAALGGLSEAVDPASPLYSETAVDLLVKIDPNAVDKLGEQLLQGLGSIDQFVAGAAIQSFIKIGASSVPILVEALGSPNPYTQQNASNCLQNIGEPAAKELIIGLGSHNQLLQQNSYNVLKNIGNKAIPYLLARADDGEPLRMANVRRLLGEMGTSSSAVKTGWKSWFKR